MVAAGGRVVGWPFFDLLDLVVLIAIVLGFCSSTANLGIAASAMPPPLCPPPASRLARRVRALIYEEEEGASGRAVIINFSLSLSLSLSAASQAAG